MNIIIVGEAYPFLSVYSEYNHNLAYQLMSNGNTVEIITFTHNNPRNKKMSGDSAPEGLKITSMINPYSIISWDRTANYIKKLCPDEVIFAYTDTKMSFFYGHIAQKLSKNTEIKRIAIVKDIIPEDANLSDRIFPYNFVRNVDGFVYVMKGTDKEIEFFEKNPKPKKYSNLPIIGTFGNSIPREEALELLNLDPQFRYLLFFGYIRPYKGLDLLLDAFADERIRKYNVKLIIAGEFRDNVQPYIDKIHEKELEKHLELRVEYIDNRDVNKYFSASDMVMQTYKTPRESGVTRLAYHFEKPMLVTNVKKLSDIVPDGVVGYVVEPEAKKIADSIVDFYENNRREEFEKNVDKEKEKFSWTNLTKTIETFFDHE